MNRIWIIGLYMLWNIFFYVFRSENLGCFRCFEIYILDVCVVSKQVVSKCWLILITNIYIYIYLCLYFIINTFCIYIHTCSALVHTTSSYPNASSIFTLHLIIAYCIYLINMTNTQPHRYSINVYIISNNLYYFYKCICFIIQLRF